MSGLVFQFVRPGLWRSVDGYECHITRRRQSYKLGAVLQTPDGRRITAGTCPDFAAGLAWADTLVRRMRGAEPEAA